MKKIQLKHGKYALVDDEDFDYLNQFKWYAKKAHSREVHYVARSSKINGKWKNTLMHREIMDAPKGMDVDHIDNNGLNNQRSNLRVCTRSQNLRNRVKRKNVTSKYLGVCYRKADKTWIAAVHVNGNIKHLGHFKTELEAAIIRNISARKYYGEFARLNVLKKAS